MEEISYYLSLIITLLLCVIAILVFCKKVKNGKLSAKNAKNIYSFISVLTGILGGTIIFSGIAYAFSLFGIKLNFWHGQIIVAAIFFNFALGLVLLVIGRIIIGWKKLEW